MTSASASGSADSTMAHLSPSASTTLPGIPTQSDDHTNVIPTSSEDVESTRAHWDELQLTSKSQLPFSIGEPSSILEDEVSDISQTISSIKPTTSVAEVNPTVQSMPPSWNPASSVNPRTEYSSGASSFLSPTPSLPQSISASKTNIIKTSNSGLVSSSTVASPTSKVILKPSSSQNVIKTSVPTLKPNVSKTKDKLPSKSGGIPVLPTEAYKSATSSLSTDTTSATVTTTSSVVMGGFPKGITPYSGGSKENKTGYVERGSDYPNATILFIIVPVCVVVILVLSAILIACVRRRKYMKKPATNQSPDLWVNTQSEIALVPATASGIDTPLEIAPGFKPGDIICRVVYPFKAQLEGQMNLTEKELVKILEKADNGWWRGSSQNGEHSGWFPGCYVEEVKPGDIEDGTQSQSKGKSRVSSFMLKKRERIRRKSATAVSPIELNTDSSIPSVPTSRTLPALNSAEINKFNDGRIFKTLFSYHASSKGELSIEEGDIVRGWEKDRNGWMHGRKVITGEEGWFPAVYVDEIPSDTSSISGESTLSGPIMYDQLAPNKNRKSDQEWLGIEHRALHSYLGNSETDLVFEAGDIIIIYETLDNGWWLGSRGEDVGWLPGSYLEILDSSRDDESRSDISSLLSSNDDRNRALEDELSHMTSNQSLNSTFSDSKPKPKPARKAPPPPKLKPLKIPIRDIGQHSQQNVKSELHNVILSNQSPINQEKNIQSNEIKPVPSLVKTPSSSKPRRPAPPPPPQRAVSQQSQVQSQTVSPDLESVSTTIATTSASSISEPRLKPGEKPFLPKRFAKPKVIRIPRQSSKLQNLAINSRPSSRPAPPRPPPPKLGKNVRGNSAMKVQSNSQPVTCVKRGDSIPGPSALNSVKNVSVEHENLQTGKVTPRNASVLVTPRQKVTPISVPPITVPSKVIPSDPNPSEKKTDEAVHVQSANKLDSEVPQNSATVEDSPKVFVSVSPEIFLKESGKGDIPIPVSDEPRTVENEAETSDIPPPTHLYPLEMGPTLSPPVVPPVEPVVVPSEPTPIVPPVRPPYGPRMSPPVDGSPSTSSEVSPEVPQMSPPVDNSPVNTPVDSSEVTQISSPVEIPPIKLPVVPPLSPPIVPRQSSPVEIPSSEAPVVPSKDEDTENTFLSPFPEEHNLLRKNKSDEERDISASLSPSVGPPIETETNHNVAIKPAPPPKPTRVPPPVLPKPKIKPKPVNLPIVTDIPPEDASSKGTDTVMDNGKLSTKDIPSPPLSSVNAGCTNGTPSPVIQEDAVVENSNTARKSDSDDSANINTCVENCGNTNSSTDISIEEVSAPSQTPPDVSEDVTGRHSEDDPSDSDSDEYLRNGDITSDSSATYGSSSDKSDTILLGTDVGESDDQQLNLSDKSDSVEDVGQTSSREQSTDGHTQTDNHLEQSNGDTKPYNGYSVDSKVNAKDIEPSHDEQTVNDQFPQLPVSVLPGSANGQFEASSGQPDLVNGQLEESNGQPDASSDQPVCSDSPPVDTRIEGKPVPLPRTALSPKMERSEVPPARPPPPKSPPPKAHRMVNQGEGTNKAKKKTLRRAVKSYTPQGKGELTFEEGSFIKEMSKAIGRPGWCIGMLADGTTGLYPVSHVEDAVTSRQSTA